MNVQVNAAGQVPVRRLAGMLARKGYGGGISMQAIREELANLDLEDPEEDLS